MSWAEEDWTVGLSGRVLQKVKELQVLKDRLSRESKQKQLQLDNIHISLDKQTVKCEEMRGELQSVQRELQRVQNEATAAVTSRERLTQELQTKQAQVCSLEGQLDAAHTLNNKLTQEVKRLEAELEKLQNSSRSADTTLFSTPCWNAPSPWEHNGSRKEERAHRDEGQSRVLHSRQRLQFSDVATPSLPQQQHKNTSRRHPSSQSDSFSTPLAVFPWERDDSRPVARRQSPSSPQMPCAGDIRHVQSEQRCSEKEKDYRTEKDSSSLALLSRVSALEEELCMKAETLKSTQNEMVQIKKDFAAKELSHQRAQNELSLANDRVAKESERASGAEQRQKQLQEELRCQRQNAESSRLQYQQRSKEQEKQHQRDIAELQKERQCLEKQHQLEVNKLNQELQQARALHNALQAQADKLSLQKQQLDKELDALKEKLKWTEGQLQQSQKKEAQTQTKLTEAVREAERVAVCLEQSRKKENALEEEGRRLAEERADALRLVKELQEQQAAPASLVHPVPFCPVGQSFSPQTSYSLNSRLSTRIKSTAAREENVDKRRVEISASYPSEREPGEGIDSEQITLISPDSEGLQRRGHRRKINEEENKSKNEAIDRNSSGTNKHSTFDCALSTSSHSAADTPTNTSIDGDCGNLMLSTEKAPSFKSEQAKTSDDLRRENDTLRSELHDVREELQKRLDDLEAQRRAEAEARTRLKQLSRKHASQSVEKEEQDKEWRAQLEKEKAETERLRKAMAALETEIKRGRETRERNERMEQEEEKTKLLEDRESEMIELNIQLKKQLAEVKAQLTLEREERKREEEERNQMTKPDMSLKKKLGMTLQEFDAELEVIKCSREDSLEEDKLSVASSPLTYLTLHDNELNSIDKSLLPSPEHHLLCESTNQRNMLESQAAADLIQEGEKVIEHSPLLASDHEDTIQNYLLGSSRSGRELSDAQKDEENFKKEVHRLQKENVEQTERANQCQGKLEALQSQVTLQTQQLNDAFEKQSQHIAGLLAELQEKERALLSQGGELQHYKQELSALKDQKEKDEKKRREEMMIKEVEDGEQKEKAQKEGLMVISGLQLDQEKECAVTSLNTKSPADSDSTAQRDARPEIVTSASGKSTHICDNEALCSGEQHPDSADSDKTQRHHEIEESQDRGAANLVAELQLDQLLKQRMPALTIFNTRAPALHAANEHPEDAVKQSENTGNINLPCWAEPRSPSVPYATSTEAQHSPLQYEKKSEGRDLAKEDWSTEEESGAVCQLQVNSLQQQVVELQMIIRALHEEIKQQATELAVWRLASQPAPTFDQSEHRQGVQKSSCNVTVIREDELLLSCSSNKLKGHMLSSRLQHSNLPESKSLHPSNKTTAALQKSNQKDSEKENKEIILSHSSKSCQSQHKEKRDTEVIQMSPEKMCQQHVGKDSHPISGTKQTKASRRHLGTPEAKADVSRQTTGINTAKDPSGRDVWIEMKTVSSQTEESLCPGCPPKESIQLRCSSTQTEEVEDEGEPVESPPPTSSLPLTEAAESGDAMLFSGTFPIPADPASLAERIRRNRTQLSAAFDDTEYEPYGLPEVVMKGFADIPSGPSCPYIVRRGLLGTAVVPVPQKNQELEETD